MTTDSQQARAGREGQTLSDQDLGLMVMALDSGSCTLLLGSGVDVTTQEGESLNLVRELAGRLAGKPMGKSVHLPTIASRYVQEHGGRGYLDLEVKRFYKDARDRIGEVRKDHADDGVLARLARLPFRMIITSRHDHTIDDHLAAEGKQPQVVCFDLDEESPYIPEPTVQKPVVFYLCGDLEKPSSLILTESDVLKLVDRVARRDPRVPDRIRSEFTKAGAMALLVGFGVPRWYNRVILKALGMKASGDAFQSFAFGEFDEFREHWRERDGKRSADLETQLFYDEEFRIRTVLDQHLEDLVGELFDRWQLEGATRPTENGSPVLRPPSQDKGKVFISYCSEDQEHARAIHAEMLKRPELEPFIDADGLREGDRWLERLKEQVRQSDFFVLLVSPTLHHREETVVHEEVLFAQAHLRRLPPKKRKKFIFPLLVGGETQIYGGDGFEEIHHGGDLHRMIDAICEEQRRRINP